MIAEYRTPKNQDDGRDATHIAAVSGKTKKDHEHDFSVVFKQFDTDGSGNLDKQELKRAIRAIGLPGEMLDTYWLELDADGNNVRGVILGGVVFSGEDGEIFRKR